VCGWRLLRTPCLDTGVPQVTHEFKPPAGVQEGEVDAAGDGTLALSPRLCLLPFLVQAEMFPGMRPPRWLALLMLRLWRMHPGLQLAVLLGGGYTPGPS